MADDLNPGKVLSALGNELRWEMLKLLADGSALHAAAVARHFDRDFDGISKHLRILRSAGVLKSKRSKDRRVEQYYVPAVFRQIHGQIDLGFCLFRLSEARPDLKEEPISEKPAPALPKSPKSSEPEDFDEEEDEETMPGFGEMLVRTATRGSGE
ncbi:MAG: winged helix-turn-helix transcriptional regulator [Verrucomicrobiae bacterium]|nr:winged helix-turn-helix transcriptional regulator [Verrucomicrobiae bacterium]